MINATVKQQVIGANIPHNPIEVDNDRVKVVKGDKGAVFTPHVDEDSNLSWSNNGGLPNPPTQNIRGKDGDATVHAISNMEIEAIMGGI